MNWIRLIFFALVSLVILGAPGRAVAGDYSVRAVSPELKVPAGGESFIALVFDIPGNHHIYGNPLGPGTGKPTTVTVRQGAEGVAFQAPRFPEARIYYAPGDRGFVRIYEKKTHVFLPLKIEGNAAPGRRSVMLHVDTLLCTDASCIPRDFIVNCAITVLPRGDKAPAHDPGLAAMFASAAEAGQAVVGAAGSADSRQPAVDIPYDFQPRYITAESVTNIFQAILFGLLAGFILNFMPCVLPVVSLKIMGFVTMGHDDPKKVFRISLVFSFGIITAFLVLASLAAFLGYGWGELFKKKEFIIGMIGIIFALGLSMFEVFTLMPPSFSGSAAGRGVNPYADAYAKGLLATLLATPCSGPFLGGTLAWALMQPPLTVFAIFTSVGAGMALPYVLLSANPSLLRFVPKPGEWTITLERVMGFFLMATVVYLIGVLEARLAAPTLWFLLFIFAGVWQYGRYGSPLNSRLTRALSALALVVIVGGGYFVTFHAGAGDQGGALEIERREFSLQRLADNNSQGKISVVKFTADWCPNCVMVERTALYTERVEKILKDNGIDLMVADITRPNPVAEGLMAKLGSRSIPFLAVFPSGEQFLKPYCLRDIYSEDDVLGALDRALKAVPDIDVNSIKFNR
jgi:thiol:disulfide interchange protein DsbD